MTTQPPAPAPAPAAPASDGDGHRDVQVRHPWHFRLLVRVVTTIGAIVLWCWFRTIRITVINGAEEKVLRTKGPILYATWHRGVLCTIWFWRWRGGFYLASASKDGEWAAGLVRCFGNVTIRGSSSRGGRAAMAQMVDALKSGVSGGIIPDAPRGPARVSKPGALVVAQRSGCTLLPVALAMEHGIRLKSWDRTMLPRPFTRFVAKFGEPFHVDPALEGEAFARRLAEFDIVMNRLADDVDGHFQKAATKNGAA